MSRSNSIPAQDSFDLYGEGHPLGGSANSLEERPRAISRSGSFRDSTDEGEVWNVCFVAWLTTCVTLISLLCISSPRLFTLTGLQHVVVVLSGNRLNFSSQLLVFNLKFYPEVDSGQVLDFPYHRPDCCSYLQLGSRLASERNMNRSKTRIQDFPQSQIETFSLFLLKQTVFLFSHYHVIC